MDFLYQCERFFIARDMLVFLRHDGKDPGEDNSIVDAIQECNLGLENLDRIKLDENARAWVQRLEELIDTTGFLDSASKVRQLSLDEKV
jgi:hypothetical protein